MSHALALHSKPLALELHALLKDLDPARFRAEVEAAMRRRVSRIDEGISSLLTRSTEASGEGAEGHGSVRQRLVDVATLLRERVPSPDLPTDELREAWARYRIQLQLAYEALSTSLRRRRVHVPAVRPTNYTRSVAHALISASLVVLVEYVLSPRDRAVIPAAFAIFFWFLEGLRHYNAKARAFLLWFFSAVAHPHERHQVNSSTWFTTALAILGIAFEPIPAVVAIAVLGFADPAAALVGRKLGTIKLVGSRSLEGTITFLLVGTGIAACVLGYWHADLGVGAILTIAFAGALGGGVAELCSGSKVDDNFSIPLAAATSAWLAVQLLV